MEKAGTVIEREIKGVRSRHSHSPVVVTCLGLTNKLPVLNYKTRTQL